VDRQEKPTRNFVRDPPKWIVAMRIPNIEEIPAAGDQNAISLAIRFVFVRKEHQAELAHDGVEAAIPEGQRRGVGRLEFDLLAGPELCARNFQHWRIEIGRDQMCGGRQAIA